MPTCAWLPHPDFFTENGERIRTTRGDRREQDSRLPLPGALLTRKWKGRTLLVEVLKNGFVTRTGTIPRSAPLRQRSPARAGTACRD